MSAAPLRLRGDDAALGLAGLADDAPDDAPTVHLGEPAEPPAPGDVVWLPGRATAYDGARVIATRGDGLWSRAPWPARDELFELAQPARPLALVVCDDPERAAAVTDKLAERGHSVRAAARLTPGDLADASVVALLGDADAASRDAPGAATAMPGEAPAVLAARRVLIAPRCETTFGLLGGTDHLPFGTHDDAVQYADAALTFPASFEPVRALGASTAERHRASTIYARLAAELRSAPRSSAPRG